MPFVSTASMRVFHISSVPILAAVSISTMAFTRSGRSAASPWAMIPPMERPTP